MKKADKRKMIVEAAAAGVAARHNLLDRYLDDIIDMADAITRVMRRGGTLYLAGNGGSAADCQHFATEMVIRLSSKFKRPSLPAVSLTADSNLLTAAGNDFGFDLVFARQCESLLHRKDALMVISTSGNSQNLIEAARVARQKAAAVYALLGFDGGKIKRYSEKKIIVPSDSVQRVQEEHIFIIHNLVGLVERALFA